MDSRTNPILEPFLRAADAASRQRSDVDADIARELMAEAATLLHNGLALDDLDAHDAAAVIDVLSNDLVARDPGAAVRARVRIVVDEPGEFHDAAAVSAAIQTSAAILQL